MGAQPRQRAAQGVIGGVFGGVVFLKSQVREGIEPFGAFHQNAVLGADCFQDGLAVGFVLLIIRRQAAHIVFDLLSHLFLFEEDLAVVEIFGRNAGEHLLFTPQ